MAKKRLAEKRTTERDASSPKKTDRKAATKSTVSKKKKAKPKPTGKSPAGTKRAARKSAPAKTVKKSVPKRKRPTLGSRIKALDREIVKLINKRAEATTKLFDRRQQSGESLFDQPADDAMWLELAETNRGPLPDQAVRGVFREILSAARQQVKQTRIAYLGPSFSFTHLAAIERFGDLADLVPVSTIASVFEEVNRGHSEYGLVPIENSTDGRVVDTLHMFTRLPLRICGEVLMSVHHNLLARCSRSEVTEIYSKPQALSQCRDWLSHNMPQARQIEVTSTSTAAQLARDKHGAAAVASRQAAVEYDLQIIAEKIEDNVNNVTRFAVIGHDVNKASGKDRTALLLQVTHKPGALSDALTIFKQNKINLTWIESFPIRGPQGGYLFFLDFEGHEREPRIRRTLEELARTAVVLNVLGSFPRSSPID
ncbi:MAG: prephenate dehydratase [Planctomycetes bacterium]|nr:prephenate dehydratase [Planctomycetota bacterium]